MTTTPTQPMQDLPCTVPRMPEVVSVAVLCRGTHPRLQPAGWSAAIVQIVDFYPADEIIRRTAKDWELTC